MLKLAHIINPVVVSENSDLFIAQPITFETMKTAQKWAQDAADVRLYSAQYPEDIVMVPEGFIKTPDLEHSILDLGDFTRQRKLPLIKDILDRLYEATNADYLIYTNVDIALMPHFYLAIQQLIDLGYDAFSINRRIIDRKYQQVSEISLMYGEVGKPHGGHDCFIFKRELYPNFYLANICVGIQFIGLSLVLNCLSNSSKFRIFEDLHLTFHIGEDKRWKNDIINDYRLHNAQERQKIISYFSPSNQLLKNDLIPKIKQTVMNVLDKYKNN